jgi:DNA topoisomerase-3
VDEVLEHFRYTGPVQRIWLASLDSRSIQKALATLKDNRDYANLRDSARARPTGS